MIEINVVYTKTGDDGTTALADGERYSKADLAIEAIGTIDELNAQIGMTIATLSRAPGLTKTQHQLTRIQSELFNLGSELALQATEANPGCPCIVDNDIKTLESSIDEHNQDLPALNNFILPGGSDIAARLHICRTVCRRAERRLVGLAQETTVRPQAIQYLNRLSDWLFVMARWTQQQLKLTEKFWNPPQQGNPDESQ